MTYVLQMEMDSENFRIPYRLPTLKSSPESKERKMCPRAKRHVHFTDKDDINIYISDQNMSYSGELCGDAWNLEPRTDAVANILHKVEVSALFQVDLLLEMPDVYASFAMEPSIEKHAVYNA